MPTFADLGVPAPMVEALAHEGVVTPFPIQAATLPDALAGRDVCAEAPTGSGKTLAFGIAVLARVDAAQPHHPTGLVLVPTRELAAQVRQALIPLGRAAWRYLLAVYGGARFEPQIDSLRKGASVVVATPGRLLDLLEQGHVHLDHVQVAVVDEADRMADMGFLPDVRALLDRTPPTRQTLLWSATLDGDVDQLIREYLRDPVRHEHVVVGPLAEHRVVEVEKIEKLGTAARLIRAAGPTIVFTRTRLGAEKLAEQLASAGVTAEAIHGDRSQAQRERALQAFTRGQVRALVATDVAARGIHVDGVALVIHWDLPDDPKDYLHRSGRTARAGAGGVVVSLVLRSQVRTAKRLLGALDLPMSTPTRRPSAPSVRDLARRRPAR